MLAVGVVVMKPSSRVSVTLASADTADNPVVDVNWLDTETDRDLGLQALKRTRLFADATGVLTGEISPGAHVQTDADLLAFIQ